MSDVTRKLTPREREVYDMLLSPGSTGTVEDAVEQLGVGVKIGLLGLSSVRTIGLMNGNEA